jgi:hypothetical protein
MRNLAEMPDRLNEGRGFCCRSLSWMAAGTGSLRSTGKWQALICLALASAAISTGVWWRACDRSPPGGTANQHSSAQPAAVETGRSGLSTHATRSPSHPFFATHIKRRRPSRRQSESPMVLVRGNERPLFRSPTVERATARASAANLASQEFRAVHHAERAGMTSSWSSAAPPARQS